MRRLCRRRSLDAQAESKASCAILGLLAGSVVIGVSCSRVEPPEPDGELPPIITTETGFEMVVVAAGSFQMGSHNGQADEAPIRRVYVDAFLIDRFEVTQDKFARLAGGNAFLARDPSHFKGPTRPVEMVSWVDAVLFCNQRSLAEGLEPRYVLRGGAWNCSRQACRSSCRVGEDPGFQDACFAKDAIGFRCVRRAPSAANADGE